MLLHVFSFMAGAVTAYLFLGGGKPADFDGNGRHPDTPPPTKDKAKWRTMGNMGLGGPEF